MIDEDKDLAKLLESRFPTWKTRTYYVPDMWGGITVTAPTGEKFDVKILGSENKVLVDMDRKLSDILKADLRSLFGGKKVVFEDKTPSDELNQLVAFLETIFKEVSPKLLPA